MHVVITGGTGFIGRALVSLLLAHGHMVTVLTRAREQAGRLPGGVRAVVWPAGAEQAEAGKKPEGSAKAPWWSVLDGAGAVVHLAGESIAARRWTAAQKQRVLQSRVRSTQMLVEAMAQVENRPHVLVSGSAIGYYGHRGDAQITEKDAPGADFLSQVCVAWEQAARGAEALGVRVVLLRNGIVLGRDGGALPRMLPPFRLFLGGPLGNGWQWMSWIHLDDVTSLILFLLENDCARGPVNAAAPTAETNRRFSHLLGKVLGRPARLPVPALLLRAVFGEMAGPLFFASQRVVPARALELGYRFKYTQLEPALEDIIGR